MRVALGPVLCLAAACAPEESATERTFDAHIRVAADGELDLDGVSVHPDATTPEEFEMTVRLRLAEIAKRRLRRVGSETDKGLLFSDIAPLVTIDPQARVDQFLPVLAWGSIIGVGMIEATLATSDGSRSDLPVKLSSESGVACYLFRDEGRAVLSVQFLQSTGPNTWSVFEEPQDDQAVEAKNLTWTAARELVDQRRPFGGHLRLVNHVPAHTTWSEVAPRIEQALALEPRWIEFWWDE